MPTLSRTTATRPGPRRVGLLPLVGLIFFSVSGGPFGLEPAISESGPGLAVLLVLVIPVLFGVPSALMSAELGSALPVEGGYYYWVKAGLGPGAAYAEGVWSWLVTFIDVALYPVLFVSYLGGLLAEVAGRDVDLHSRLVLLHAFPVGEDAGGGYQVSLDAGWLVCVLFVVVFGVLTARGTHAVGETSVGLLLLVMAPFAVVSVLGVVRLLQDGVPADLPFTAPDADGPVQAVGAGLAVLVWNYIGWDAVSTLGRDIERPQRTYPRALAVSVPLITVCYLLPLLAALVSGLHPGDVGAWAEGDFVPVGRALAGPGAWGTALVLAIAGAAVLSQVGLFCSLLLSGARVPEVLARDGALPASLARLHPRYRTPVRSIVVSCLVIVAFCALQFTVIITTDIVLSLAALLLEFAALIALRVRFPHMRRPFRVPGGLAGVVGITVPVVVILGWLVAVEWADPVDGPGVRLGVGLAVAGAAAWWPTRRLARPAPDAEPLDLDGVDLGPGVDARAVLEHGPRAATRLPA